MSKSEKISKLPKNETEVVSYYSRDLKLLFSLTRKSKGAGCFYLYSHDDSDGTWQFLGKGDNPTELEKKFGVEERMKG